MKLIITISLLFLITFASASPLVSTKYYVKNSGNDLASGLSSANAWQTLAKLNSFSFNPGDSIFLERGSTWHESITINSDGIYIGDYGSGAKPLITGLTSITSWTNTSGNIWESTSAVSTLATCNLLSIGNANIQMGRYPNTGYLDYESFLEYTSLTSSHLSGDTNWTGAQVVIRLYNWLANNRDILSQTGGTLTYSATQFPTQQFDTRYGYYGFFIQRDIRTLDTLHEWYFNPSTKKISVYSVGTPPTAQITTIDTLIWNNGFDNITIKNISFKGANRFAVRSINSTGLTVKNCDFDWSGNFAIGAWNANTYVTIDSCTFNHTSRTAIFMESTPDCHYPTITNNIIRNSGVIMGAGVDGNYTAVSTNGIGTVITHNRVDSTGYVPIFAWNDSTVITNNYVNTFCFLLDDGGGIYIAPNLAPLYYPHRRKILNNIVLNGIGAPVGRAFSNLAGYENDASGIYMDAGSGYADIISNTVAYCDKGIYYNNGHSVILDSNVIYGNNKSIYWNKSRPAIPMDSMRHYYNTVVAVGSTKLMMQINLQKDTLTMPVDFRADSNIYARPIADSNVFNILIQTTAYPYFSGLSYTLSEWQTWTGQDANSTKSPRAILDASELRLDYNASNDSVDVYLSKPYLDMDGTLYPIGTYRLGPWDSWVLMLTESWNPTKWVVRYKLRFQ